MNTGRIDQAWAIHQAGTTVDFSRVVEWSPGSWAA